MKIIVSGVKSALENMSLDEKLLSELQDEPVLHFYDWQRPSITYGLFIKPEDHLCLDSVLFSNIDLVKRPTGGGIVFHMWDLAFSFLLPSSNLAFKNEALDNYLFVNGILRRALLPFFEDGAAFSFYHQEACGSFCMAAPTKYDLVMFGKKVAGAAQRKTKKGYLHQGTISLYLPEEKMLATLLKDKGLVQKILESSWPLLQKGGLKKKDVVSAVKKEFEASLGM